jgi:hypothetical protein
MKNQAKQAKSIFSPHQNQNCFMFIIYKNLAKNDRIQIEKASCMHTHPPQTTTFTTHTSRLSIPVPTPPAASK